MNFSKPVSNDAARGKPHAHILLAEDHPINREVMLAVLNKLGYRGHPVPDGREAVKALQATHYDLVLMDCQMPEMDGYEAARLIRNPATRVLNPRIPIVAVTAGVMAGGRERCIEAGMDDYLSKPVQPDSLARTLDKWLCRRPQEEAPTAPGLAETPTGVSAVFDRAALVGRLMGNQPLAERVIKAFLEAAPSQLLNLRRQLAGQDAAAARREAHTLKGAAATISAPLLRGLAFEAEQAATAGDWNRIEALLPRMEDQLDRLRAAIAQLT